MRVDDGNKKPIAFDNMQNRALTGTTDWRSAAVVLDVGADAVSIHFGVLLAGRGAVDVAKLGFDEVDGTVAPTSPTRLADEPQDLDFGITHKTAPVVARQSPDAA